MKTLLRRTFIAGIGGILGIPRPAHAFDLWGEVKGTVGGAVNASIQVATAPTRAIVGAAGAIAGHNSASSIIQPLKDIGRAMGNTVAAGTQLAQSPSDFLYQQALKVAELGGDPGKFVFDLGTFQTNFINQLTTSTGQYAGAVLRQQNPLQLFGVPLAAAIRAAHAQYIVNAQPMPADVLSGLAPYFDPSVLARVKYAVGHVEITLPNFIGQGARFFGNDYAVTVDDIIVFNTPPPSFSTGAGWWAHETTHVRQYQQWNIDVFAYNYVKTFGHDVEAEAVAMGNRVAMAVGQDGNPASLRTSPSFVRSAEVNFLNTQAPVDDSQQQLPGFSSEYFVAQAFFINMTLFIHVMLTNTGRIIVVDPSSGQSMQVGWATPPRLPGVAWSLDTEFWHYAVLPDGSIVFPNGHGYSKVGQMFRAS